MAGEKKVQTRFIKYLKSKGCYVIKTSPGMGTPVGCPDVIALRGSWWGAFECKATEKSKFQPLQKETLEILHGQVVHVNNIDDIILQLDTIL